MQTNLAKRPTPHLAASHIARYQEFQEVLVQIQQRITASLMALKKWQVWVFFTVVGQWSNGTR